MTSQYKTPGVYITEPNAFPNSVVEVPTAVPAFVGYTEKAARGAVSLRNAAVLITSLAQFEMLFGGPPPLSVVADPTEQATLLRGGCFILHQAMTFFFENGGGACYIVSVGTYQTDGQPTAPSADDFIHGIDALTAEQEPTMVVTPETCLLDLAVWSKVARHALAHCASVQSRVAILDLWHGNYGLDGAVADKDAPIANFRANIGSTGLDYGVAYYPWLNTTTLGRQAVSYMTLDAGLRQALFDAVTTEQVAIYGARPLPDVLTGYLHQMRDGAASNAAHGALMQVSQHYSSMMEAALKALNLLPPSAGMAGVYTRIDNDFGVWSAPANASMMGVTSPAVEISSEQQEDLNVPLDGLAVNAIRTFAGRGLLVWGARTLDGNSQDWRYINVRRTLIMLEQSAKAALDAFVFASNDATTWVTVKAMLDNFLTNQWKAGALAGARADDAFSVAVGPGETMTANDLTEGYMRVTIKVAVVRPAEFIVFSFQQKMQQP